MCAVITLCVYSIGCMSLLKRALDAVIALYNGALYERVYIVIALYIGL